MINPTQLEFQASAAGKTQNERLREIFLANPNEWLSMIWLGQQIGGWAVHSRVGDLRKKFGMTIENKTQLVDGKRHSLYKYVAPA